MTTTSNYTVRESDFNRVIDYKNALYTREYSNDLAPRELQIRIAFAALPFLSLHTPFRYPISLAMCVIRTWNTKNTHILHTSIAVTALAGTIFKHQFGIILTTLHDIILEIQLLAKSSTKSDAIRSLFKIFNHLIYCTLIAAGGLELSILVFALQCVASLLQSEKEFQKGHWIEGVTNLLMSGVRLYQCHNQLQEIKRCGSMHEPSNAIPISSQPPSRLPVCQHSLPTCHPAT
jgi:hypothetical protein